MKIVLFIIVPIGLITGLFWLTNRHTRKNPRKLSQEYVIATLSDFLDNKGGAYDWDDFLTFPVADPELEAVRKRCREIDWNSESGKESVREELDRLKS